MICSNCGNEIEPGTGFCPNCGTKVTHPNPSAAPEPQPYAPQYSQQSNTVYGNTNQNPDQDPRFDYTPISMWGYFGYEILFNIPCIGFILLLVFSFGGTKNINLRNFARSYFCFLIVAVILVVLLGSILGVAITGVSITDMFY
jgi:hypothetical protein